jgi:hypothetical protein
MKMKRSAKKRMIFTILTVLITFVLIILPVGRHQESILSELLTDFWLSFVILIPFIFVLLGFIYKRYYLSLIQVQVFYVIQGIVFFVMASLAYFVIQFSLNFTIWGHSPPNEEILEMNRIVIGLFMLFFVLWSFALAIPVLNRKEYVSFFFTNPTFYYCVYINKNGVGVVEERFVLSTNKNQLNKYLSDFKSESPDQLMEIRDIHSFEPDNRSYFYFMKNAKDGICEGHVSDLLYVNHESNKINIVV